MPCHASTGPASPAEPLPLPSPCRVPALPVKNLNGTGPVHPALAGERGPASGWATMRGDTVGGERGTLPGVGRTDRRTDRRSPGSGMTGILMCAAGLPVCLTRAPKPILHPPPVSKSDIKPVPGVNGICRKTKKKQLKKSKEPPMSQRDQGHGDTRGKVRPPRGSRAAMPIAALCHVVSLSWWQGVAALSPSCGRGVVAPRAGSDVIPLR